ncbi:tetratricopeptide repeat protein [Streptomyces sp. VNUA116]|uniref:tetratricopeptide repeat protein n=1 Tax=Streptomyces sp. VNUA116 TaxID=3062449 RepID=UPI002675EE5E|nr:tetratricopeptide repeat protein [Streptomyces sp. VNUA116]WKU42649.1 tetratricopeptide repeat protein [Streptomyces sp. VNUA116]
MGRIENPIDWSIPARGELAALLRTARKEAGITYQELSERTGLSSATLKRAASGRVLPSEITIEQFLTACGGSAQDTTHATALRCDARRQEFGPPGRTVRIALISAPAELGNALVGLYRNAGAPTYRKMQARAGTHWLALSSLSRILNRQMLPGSRGQMIAFLQGCGVPEKQQGDWIEAWRRVCAPQAGLPAPLFTFVSDGVRITGLPPSTRLPLSNAPRHLPGARGSISRPQDGHISEKIILEERIVQGRAAHYGTDHLLTVRSRAMLAESYLAAGRTADAIALLEQVVADQDRLPSPGRPRTLDARVLLSEAYSSSGRHRQAAALLELVAADQTRLLGTDHPHTLQTCTRLATAYLRTGHAADAITLLERVAADRDHLLGADHPDTLQACARLAGAYTRTGRATDAITLYKRILTSRQHSLGPDHPVTLTTHHTLSLLKGEPDPSSPAPGSSDTVGADSPSGP